LTGVTVDPYNRSYADIDGVLFDKWDKLLHTYPQRRLDATYEVPMGIEIIGESAFFGCAALEEVVLGEGLKSIGERAFSTCTSLKQIGLPSTLEHIGFRAFSDCSSLVRIRIPSRVQSLGYEIFEDCRSLVAISVNEGSYAHSHFRYGAYGALLEIRPAWLDE
jgi:hypothetical protein